MSRFHITESGEPAECTASLRACPRGGVEDHYISAKDASNAFEKTMRPNLFKVQRKSNRDVKWKQKRVSRNQEISVSDSKRTGVRYTVHNAPPYTLLAFRNGVPVVDSSKHESPDAAKRHALKIDSLMEDKK